MKLRLSYVALLISFFFGGPSFGQYNNTNLGTDFWFGYTLTSDGLGASYVVYVTTLKTTTGNVSIPGFAYSNNFTAVPGITTRIVLPSADVVVNSFSGPVNYGVHVTANSNVSVFAAIENSARCDNTCILPVPLLGNDYYLMDYTLCQSFSDFMIVAQGCKDSVEITPSQNITVGGSHPANVPYTEVLQSGQVLVVQSSGDLTGSRVRSLNHAETGVFAGANWNCVFCNQTANPFYEELFPQNGWGKSFVFLPTAQAQDQCRVLSEQNGTVVTFTTGGGPNIKTLNAGQYYDTTVNYASPVYISATNPISVGRFMRTGSCNNYYINNPTGKGDPAEQIEQANEQMYLDTLSFYVNRSPDIDSTYVEIVTRTADKNTISLDASNIGSYFNVLAVNPTYSYASLTILNGSHSITTTGKGFVAYTCGLGFEDAIAAATGVYLKNINLSTTSTQPSSCGASDGTASVTATGIPPFTYQWSNGKTTATVTGLSAGIYTVTVSDSDCVPHKDTAMVTINGKPGYSATVVDTNPNCHVATGNSTAFPTGGTPPYTYNWSNGQTKQKATGLSAGSYTCTVTDNTGCKCFVIANIIHYTPPTVGVSPYTDSTCGPSSIPLHVFGVNTNVYNWSPPNSGLSCYVCSSPTATPTVTTTYTVSGVDSSGCTASSTITIAVLSTPKPIVKGRDSICQGYPDTLVVTGGSSYVWTGGATTDTIIRSPAFTTTYTVKASNNYCPSHDTTFTIYVVPTPTITITSAGDSVCKKDSIQLTGHGGATYKWSTGSTASSIWAKPLVPTTYKLYGYSGTCSDSASITIFIRTPPPVGIKARTDSICPYDSTYIIASGGISYKWNNNATTDSIKVKQGANTTYSVYITNTCGIDTLKETIYTRPLPTPKVTGIDSICGGKSTTLTASGGISYLWSPGNSTKSSITVSPVSTTTYTLLVSNGKCAMDTDVTVTVKPKTNGSVTPGPKVCSGTNVTLTATGGGTYLWNTGATTNAITLTANTNATYTVIVTSSNGCPDTLETSVDIKFTPTLTSFPDTVTINKGDTVFINSNSNANNYTWSPVFNLSCVTCPNPMATPTVTTTYTVTSDSAGCSIDRTVTIYVEVPCADFQVPNVFTPNNDGRNDDFVVNILNPTSYSIDIYDRWGKQVYTSTNPTEYWTGHILSTSDMVPDGVYFYTIKAACGNKSYVKKGFVEVLGGK